MNTITPVPEDEAEESDFKPLTAEEAQQLRARIAPVSLGRVLAIQALVGCLVALAAWGLTGRPAAGWTAAYGAMAVVIPAALFARGVRKHMSSGNPGTAVSGLFGWELVKIVLTVALLAAAPWVLSEVVWLALLAGMVVTLKMYWLALWVQTRSVKPT